MNVAVVIVSYNSGHLLEKCLAHLRVQTWQPDQIIVADNNSTDPETLQQLKHLEGIEVIRFTTNYGYGGAINRVAETLAEYDFIATLNPDAFPDPTWLSALMSAAARHPEYGSFASLQLQSGNRQIIDGAGDVLHISGIPWRRFHGRLLHQVQLQDETVFSACAGSALYRLPAFRDVCGFDESLFMYVEDIDLGFRLQLAGYPCRFVPAAVTEHIGSATTGADSDFTIYHGHRNLTSVYLRNMPTPILLATLPIHLLANLFSMAVLTWRGQASAIFRAKRDAVKQVGERLKQRRTVTNIVGAAYAWGLLQKWPFR